jgi:predicted MFS family arabinose efflux permease
MGILSVRFKHKSLLMTGLLLFSVSILGCSLASNFILLLIFYVLIGLGGAMVMPMTTTLVAKHLPLQKRASVLGLLMATMSVSFLIGSQVIRFISDFGGWRLSFLVYALPFPLLSLLLVFKGLPSESESEQTSLSKGSLVDGFKGVLSNRSAIACLVSNALSSAAWQGILLYGISFYRQQFLVSKGIASYIMIGASMSYTLGALISSRFVNKLGRKPVTSISAFMAGIFIFSFTTVPNLWISVALNLAGCLFAGMRVTASISLTIEQVPEFRGTMMSINSASASMGSALGSGLGGLALLLYNYGAVGPSLGLLGIASAIIVYLIAVDPTRVHI